MSDRALRRRIAYEAARLLHSGQEADYVRAKRRAVRKLGCRFRLNELPSNREVKIQLDEIEQVERTGLPRTDLRSLRLEGLRWLRRLRGFQARLVGDVAAGRSGRDVRIDVELFAADLPPLVEVLGAEPVSFHIVENATGETGTLAQVYVDTPVPVRLTVRPEQPRAKVDPANGVGPVLTLAEVERVLCDGSDASTLDLELDGIDPRTDRFEQYRVLLEQLEEVPQNPSSHPEGDALYHSLQVFELAVVERPYDEEFLTAALLHDVGKAVDPKNAAEESIRLLEGIVTFRTLELIAGQALMADYQLRHLPPQRLHELETSADLPEMQLLRDLNAAGRKSGAATRSLAEALDYLRRLEVEATAGEETGD
jgi:hypothetical protein